MGTRSDELKAEIESTRADLTGTMDAMGDRVIPGRIVARKTDKIRGSASSLRHKVMGASETVSQTRAGISAHASDVAGSAAQAAHQAPAAILDNTQGNPLAAGLVAFGLGLLAAALVPATRAEESAASDVIDLAAPAIEQVRSSAQDMAGDVKASVSDAAGELRSDLSDAVEVLRDEATMAANEVGASATDAAGDVKEQVQGSVGAVRSAQSS